MTTRILITVIILTGFATYAVVGQERNWIGAEHSYGSSQRPAAVDLIEQTLGARGKWDYADKPLDELMRDVGRRFSINIWIDKESLSSDAVATDTQVTLVLPDASLAAGLNLILDPLLLTYVIEDEVLKITTQVKADEKMRTRVYPVLDLLDVIDGVHDYSTLMMAIQGTTSGKWERTDGESGDMMPIPNARSLVIRQTQRVHREIEGLLTALRKAKRLQRIPSIAIDPNDIAVLRPESLADRQNSSRVRIPRATPSWQQPRVYSE